jgi:hypothetical protein
MQRPLSLRFGAAESNTEHRWMQTGSYYHFISTSNICYKSVAVPYMSDSAAPNLMLSIAGCILL